MKKKSMKIGYIDGRDPDAQPPLTIKHINIWDSAPPLPEGRVIKQLKHGTCVSVLQTKKYKGRTWAQVKKRRLVGWVLESFLSKRREDPIGDLIL